MRANNFGGEDYMCELKNVLNSSNMYQALG